MLCFCCEYSHVTLAKLNSQPSTCWHLTTFLLKLMIICVCSIKGKSLIILLCWRTIVLVYTRHLLLVTAPTRSTINMPKFYNPLPCPAAVCWWVQTSLEKDSRTEDAAVTLEDPNSLNNCSEQVFLLMLSNSELSKDEWTQSILAVFYIYV